MEVKLKPAKGQILGRIRKLMPISKSVAVYTATIREESASYLYNVLVSRDPLPHQLLLNDPDFRWHISVSGTNAVPEWRHLVAIAHQLRPGICFVIGVPPKSWWLNVHEFTLHLWELNDPNLINAWRSERRADTPN